MAVGLIDESAQNHFDILRQIRRRYLHLFSQAHDEVAADARKGFTSTTTLVQLALATKIKDGKVILRPGPANYLAARGNWRWAPGTKDPDA
jgi:hypothetical protein